MIAKILIDICCTTNKYNNSEIDYLIKEARFNERKELKNFKKMINESKEAIMLMKDEILIEMIKSKKLLKLVLLSIINDK